MVREIAGNFSRLCGDYPIMNRCCDDFRIALSARLDGEQFEVPAAELDAHLAGCPSCRAWLEAAQRVTRSVRAYPAEAPDLTAPILAAVAEDRAARTRPVIAQRRRILRFALALSAGLQLAMAVPMLLGLQDVAHDTREAASFDIALAVGFALAARWPERARAFVPVAFVLAGCLALTSAFDIAEGATLFTHEIAHLAALAQAALLWALSRYTPVTTVPRPRTSVS